VHRRGVWVFQVLPEWTKHSENWAIPYVLSFASATRD
jgi:hypothetical protein